MAKRTLTDELRRSAKAKPAADDDVDATEDDDVVLTDETEDEDTDDADSDDDADDEDDEELGEGGKKALRAERKKNRQLTRDLRDARKAAPAAKPKPKGGADDDADNGPTDRELRVENRLKASSLKSGLIEAGVSSRNVRLLVGQADLDDLELDDDDEVDGVKDVIDELKDEFPDLFGKADDDAPRRRVTRRDGDAAGQRPPRRTPNSTDRIVELLVGKG